jgi:hypothetical protein
MPLSSQKAFLRVIQERRCRPVGGQEETEIDFRLVAATHRDLFTSVASLNTRLRRPMRPAAIGILIPGHARDLLCFAAMRHLMGDMRIVLVLPDSRPQTISDGHALHPRFISYADSDLKDVEAVVAKMVATLQGRRSLATAETAG